MQKKSECHQTCLFGRVANLWSSESSVNSLKHCRVVTEEDKVNEEDEVNESIFDRRSEIRNDRLVSLLSPFPNIKEFIEVEENKEVMGIRV